MSERLVTRREIEERFGMTRSTIYRQMRAGNFPEPVQISPKAVRWRETELEEWEASLPRATGETPAPAAA